IEVCLDHVLLAVEQEEVVDAAEDAEPVGGVVEVGAEDLDGINDLLVFKAGLGFRVSFFEIGAALQLRTQLDETFVSDGFASASLATATPTPASGGHQGSILPYLIIRPPNFPAALSLKGGVQNEYADYGLSLGGANDFKTNFGFTATLSIGFD
ncbi:MAG: hypothetical protein AAFR95_09065, partial [Bacteroidota bacterium]